MPLLRPGVGSPVAGPGGGSWGRGQERRVVRRTPYHDAPTTAWFVIFIAEVLGKLRFRRKKVGLAAVANSSFPQPINTKFSVIGEKWGSRDADEDKIEVGWTTTKTNQN